MSEGLANLQKSPIEVPPHEFPRNVVSEGMGIALNDLPRLGGPAAPLAILELPSKQTPMFDLPENTPRTEAVAHEQRMARKRSIAASFKIYSRGEGADRVYSLESVGGDKSADPEEEIALKAGDELPIGRAEGWWLPAGVSGQRDQAKQISFHQGIMKVDKNGSLYYLNLGRNPVAVPNREEVPTFRISQFESSDNTVALKMPEKTVPSSPDTAPIKIIPAELPATESKPPNQTTEQDDRTAGLGIEKLQAQAPDLTHALGKLANNAKAEANKDNKENEEESPYSMGSQPDNSRPDHKKSPPQYGGDRHLPEDDKIKTP